MKTRRFIQVDVFSSVPLKGNGLAVVVDAEGLSDQEMQDFAAWTNLAETTFLFPSDHPEADYRVRIFTPGREMPFAGHPTLGSCAAWLATGGVPKVAGQVVQECAVGLVPIDISGEVPAFRAPPTTSAPLPEAETDRLIEALGLDARDVRHAVQLDNGPVWSLLVLADAATVLAIDAGRVAWPEFVGLGVVGAHPPGQGADFEVRNLAPSSGMIEDPITGSLNAAIACWFAETGRLTAPLVMAQGTKIGREGRVFIRPGPDGILVGGATQILIEGTVTL